VTLAGQLADALQSMRDVRGMQGSFVVSDFGRLLARDMPAMFGDDILGEVGPRALRLRETLCYSSEELQSCTVRYADFLLFLRPLRDGLLCVLTAADVNQAVMRMAINLAIRRLNVLFDTAAPPRAAPPSAAATGPVASDATRVARTQELPVVGPRGPEAAPDRGPDRPQRMYRGRPITDPE
jgi:predicted regulator of Ras-like GTPase activity (Roadblock/LC7/MglB family)